MKILYTEIESWPPLAWLASCDASGPTVSVLHGSRVEANGDWFCEAAWAGDYDAGDLDQTDLICGSGGRVRGGRITFVSSGSTVDRLHVLRSGGRSWTSNSLACLMAATGGRLRPSNPNYARDMRSIVRGLRAYRPLMETSAGMVELVYFHNVCWDGRDARVESKPGGPRDFSSFGRYRDFLESSLEAFARNLSSPGRRHPFRMLGSLSTGYDSPTVTALAKPFGCDEVITFDAARDGEEDDGTAIAEHLGIRPIRLHSDAWKSDRAADILIIVAQGSNNPPFYRAAEAILGSRALLTGYHGDYVWGMKPRDLGPDIVRGDGSGLGLTEYRLSAGFLHCPVPFWGVRQVREIDAISRSEEMRPWVLPGTDYNRPICRRIVEEAGVPRGLFGVSKKAVGPSHLDLLLEPSMKADYLDWIRQRHWDWIRRCRIPPIDSEWLDDRIHSFARSVNILASGIDRRCGHLPGIGPPLRYFAEKGLETWNLRRYIVPWAVDRAMKYYPIP